MYFWDSPTRQLKAEALQKVPLAFRTEIPDLPKPIFGVSVRQ
jgi:hypothetical protein